LRLLGCELLLERVEPRLEREALALEFELPDFFPDFAVPDAEVARAI
jgi:hypothetical protein